MAILEIQNLIKRYVTPTGERLDVLDVPRFSMEGGEHVAMVGESGSGKTTLLNIIAGILRADSGTVSVAGTDFSRLGEGRRDRARARHIGYVFQTFNLLQGYTALENVELGMMFGKGVDRAFARHLLDRVGMSERMHYRPSQLSVGQQQRVAVARALANRPELVLADEPTGNLDPQNAYTSMRLIREVCEENGTALLVVSHDQRVINSFDRRESLAAINRAATTAERASAGVEEPDAAGFAVSSASGSSSSTEAARGEQDTRRQTGTDEEETH